MFRLGSGNSDIRLRSPIVAFAAIVNEPLSKDSGCEAALIDSVVIVGSTPTNAGSIVVISISSSGIKLVSVHI